NQTNPSAGFQDKFGAEKAGEEINQQYMLFLVWSFGSTNPQNNDGDAAFDGKEHDFDAKKFESEVIVSPSSSAQLRKQDDKTKKEAKGKSHRVHQALKDPSWIEAMKEELLQFKMQKVWVLVDLPQEKRAIGTKWVFKNKNDESGIVVRNKAILIAQGHTQEEGINYEEVFALVERIEAIRLFLAYASFMGFMVYQMDVKSAFLYGTIKEEVYVCQPLGFEDPDHPDKVYKVVTVVLSGMESLKRLSHVSYLLSAGYLTTQQMAYVTAVSSYVTAVKVNDVTRLQALVDKKKVVITEAAIREVLRLDDAEGVDYLSNKVENSNFLKEDKKVEEAKVDESAQVQGRQTKSQAEIYKIDMDHANKVLSMQEDEFEPAKVQEVVDVVTTTKLITKVVTAASETVIAAKSTTSEIIPAETKSKDKGKGILVEEPKPLKKKQQIKIGEEYARELHAELNKAIDWNVAIDNVKLKAKQDPDVQRYQATKRKPQTEAQAQKNMMMYLKNVAGFKLDYFKGMSYDEIHPIFKVKCNSNVDFLLKTKEQMEEEENKSFSSINKTPVEKAAKRRKLNKEVEDLKRNLKIVPDEDDDVYTEATPIARNVSVVDYEIIELNSKPYYKIIRVDGTRQLYIRFLTFLKNFNREDLEALWNLVKERFSTSNPKNFSDDFLLTTLGAMFEKPDALAQV
nr:putative ribonuclease H-like domain-containing protein [Tanacetum cinerariifolium]